MCLTDADNDNNYCDNDYDYFVAFLEEFQFQPDTLKPLQHTEDDVFLFDMRKYANLLQVW
jgi:hypothetical protein